MGEAMQKFSVVWTLPLYAPLYICALFDSWCWIIESLIVEIWKCICGENSAQWKTKWNNGREIYVKSYLVAICWAILELTMEQKLA